MPWDYGVALFIHVFGAVTLFAAIAMELLCGMNLLRTRTVDHARIWTRAMKVIEPMYPIATVLLIGAGVYLALTQFSFRTPFVVVGLVTLVAIAIESLIVQGRSWRSVAGEVAEAPDGPLPEDVMARMRRPVLWSSTFADTTAAIGVLVIMTTKPSWLWSIGIVAGLTIIGGVIGPMVVRQPQPTPAAPPKIA